MSVDIKQLQERRGQLAKNIQELADTADSWNAEQRAAWDKVNADYDEVKAQIDSHDLALQVEARKKLLSDDEQRATSGPMTLQGSGGFSAKPAAPTMEQRALALQGWMLKANNKALTEHHKQAARDCGLDFRGDHLDVKIRMSSPLSGFEMFSTQGGRVNWEMFERRRKDRDALEMRMDTTTAGAGLEFIPTLFMYELEKAMMAYGGLRRVARLMPTGNGNPLEWPTVNDLANKAVIVDEGADIGSDTPPTTGQIIFGAYKYTSLPVLVTEELLEDSAFGMAALLGNLLGERLGRGQAEHFAIGDGATQPQGVVTGSSQGAVAAAADTIISDELIDLQTSLDPAYAALSSVGWSFNNKTLAAIRKLKTGDDQYLWRAGLTLGEPDLLLGSPYIVCQEMPDIATGTKPIVYGAMEKFVIRDVSNVRFYRLNELYRQTDKTGFLALSRTDSKVIQPLALKHLLMA